MVAGQVSGVGILFDALLVRGRDLAVQRFWKPERGVDQLFSRLNWHVLCRHDWNTNRECGNLSTKIFSNFLDASSVRE